MRALFVSILLLVALALCPGLARCAESYANCAHVITSLPVVVNAPGTWCLKQNLSTALSSGFVVRVTSDNVTLDCNDFLLSGIAGAATAAYGIYGASRHNITIRHCRVQGFEFGILLINQANALSSGHLVEDNRIEDNWYTGIRVDGVGVVIRHNMILNTGRSTIAASAYGIYNDGRCCGTAGAGVSIQDNLISGVSARAGGNGSVYGIYSYQGAFIDIRDNRIRGLAKDGTGKTYGVFPTAGPTIISHNDFYGDGSAGSNGVICPVATKGVVATDNLIEGFSVGIRNCLDGGQNDVSH